MGKVLPPGICSSKAPSGWQTGNWTRLPAFPEVGEKPLRVGGGLTGVTVKGDELEALSPAVVTEIGPVVAPAGTVAWRRESESTL